MERCCLSGFRHGGESAGRWDMIDDVETYLTYPATSSVKYGLIFLSDGFGPHLLNSQLMADGFAAQGFVVALPDLFNGDPVPDGLPEGFDVSAWIGRHQPSHIDPIITRIVHHMRSQIGCEKIAGIGYCIGAKYVARFLRPDQRQIDAGFAAHPSFLTPDEVREIRGPLSLGCAEHDETFPIDLRYDCEKQLQETRSAYEIHVYGGMHHGFAIRGDQADRSQAAAMGRAFRQATSWFQWHFGIET